MRCRLQTLVRGYIADTHFDAENEIISVFNDINKGKNKFWFKKRYRGIGSPISFLGNGTIFRLQEKKAVAIEFNQLCNVKLIPSKANSSNWLQFLKEMSRCPQENMYRTPSSMKSKK